MFFAIIQLIAQEYFPTNTSVKHTNENYTAFTNATIHVSPTETIKNGTLLIKGEKIVSVGNVVIPKNATVINIEGKHIYASFIDMFSNFGIKKAERATRSNSPQYDAGRDGYYWNDHIIPDQRAFEAYKFDSKKANELVNAGFGAVSTHQKDGIMRGTGMVVTLNTRGNSATNILTTDATQHLSFSKSVTSRQSYPTSTMGAMALIRQTYDDAKWYSGGNSKTKDLALEALNKNKNLPIVFDASNLDNELRAAKIASEYDLNYIIKGNGFEYENIDAISKSGFQYIIPLDFPAAYDVSDPYQASKLSLGAMRQWNQAPRNLAILAENNITFAITSADLKTAKEMKTNLLKAIEYGLDKEIALAALTTVPAKMLGKSSELGIIKNGSYANFLITSDEIFNKKTILYENWVQGAKHVVTDMNIKDIRGEYTLNVNGKSYDLSISGEIAKPKSSIKLDSTKVNSKMSLKNGWVHIFFAEGDANKTEFVRLSAQTSKSNTLTGNGTLRNGSTTTWSALKKESSKKEEKKNEDKKDASPVIMNATYPNVAYGYKKKPTSESILFKNVTVWTNEADGVLENTDVLIKDGKISKIGQNLKAGKATVIDGTGKHLTSGIIDEHSHIAATSINEAGHNSTAEVTIEDVLDADDINIYRNLAGGVTTIQILHGSANPIGGRSAIIKLKWGETPDGLVYENSPKFIKFALGENVKQSNWGDFNRIRFPQTRMGVEQVYIDYFQRAKEYDDLKKSGNPYRKDAELEALSEILNKERFISCHSYVQSEINMLMKVAEQFDFNINTFTHILEGYKVADKMKEHGVGGSTFSDWWAYKYEVNDAIPYNGAIMHSQGVTVAFNSDDAEMSRRLNQEAAKAVKYGGVSEEDAWKFVTLNPAKLLHIDDRTGSIKVGKDADLVLWSDHPMSIYSKAEKTLIEGVTYFDIDTNDTMVKEVNAERNQLINMMIEAKNKGMKVQPVVEKKKIHFHCDSLENL
ncbi:amidohydrolase family protein [Urechidicola sp. KH5]